MSGRLRKVIWSTRYTLWSEWESLTTDWPNPGVYVISRQRPVRRLGGLDRAGVLYVGKSSHVGARLKQFVNCNHPASFFLWHHRSMARFDLGRASATRRGIETKLEQLLFRVAEVHMEDMATAERAVLSAYIHRFGEMPPLNMSLPGRWKEHVTSALVRWGTQGFGGDA